MCHSDSTIRSTISSNNDQHRINSNCTHTYTHARIIAIARALFRSVCLIFPLLLLSSPFLSLPSLLSLAPIFSDPLHSTQLMSVDSSSFGFGHSSTPTAAQMATTIAATPASSSSGNIFGASAVQNHVTSNSTSLAPQPSTSSSSSISPSSSNQSQPHERPQVYGGARQGAKPYQEDSFFSWCSPTNKVIVGGIFGQCRTI